MARIISVLSARPGAGQTTITVNLASGLARKAYRVLVAVGGRNHKASTWMAIHQENVVRLPSREGISPADTVAQAEVHFIGIDASFDLSGTLNHDYDFIFLLPATTPECKSLLELSDHTIVCGDLSHNNTASNIISLDRDFYAWQNNTKHFSLIVLNKVNTKEWHHNAEHFSALADYFGDEQIADPIPYCERIHDLPLEGRTVWELHQENLHDAFRRLTEAVEVLSKQQ